MVINLNNFNKEQFEKMFKTGKDGDNVVWEQPAKPAMKPAKRIILSLVITLVIGAIYYYFALPVFNIHAGETYKFIILLCIIFMLCNIIFGQVRSGSPGGYIAYAKKSMKIPLIIIAAALVVAIVGSVIGFKIFRASDYANILQVSTGDFAEDVSEISFNQIPMLDSASANNLANRKLGDLSDLVSQFNVSEDSAQINYNDHPIRVTYLNYDGFFKWWKNRSNGLPAYITIDMVTQDVNVVRLSEGMKYSPSEIFNRNLMRHLRFNYPTFMFDNVNFEIDEDGTPYWVASVLKKTIGLFDGDDIEGAVLVNAITGECTYYDVASVPTWVDRVYSADLLINQYNLHGQYINGFLNSYFGQTDCTVTTDGYNYIAKDDDVWLYTGITSITNDRGNIGFILVNQRTKEARYYACAGAEEYSAMNSAQGAVQQYSYQATFPLLLNIADEPTYFMALKDTAGLVKMYAMVNVQQYQIVAIGNTVQDCQASYRNLLIDKGILTEKEADESSLSESYEAFTASGVIEDIRTADKSGDTYFYIKLKGDDTYYSINARNCELAVILNTGDTVEISYAEEKQAITSATAITR